MDIHHINGSACGIASRLNRDLMQFAGQSFQNHNLRADAVLKSLLDPDVSVRKMEVSGRHLGWAAVVTEPVYYKMHDFVCRTVIVTCAVWPRHQRKKAEADAADLEERLAA